MKRLVIHVKIAVLRNVISTYILTYKGNSLRKWLHNHRCYFGFPFDVSFCQVISYICIAISESGNTNSQVGKWCIFSQLISFFIDGFDINFMDNISMLQNSVFVSCFRDKSYEAFSSAPVHWDCDSQFQTFLLLLHMRLTFLIRNWLTNSGAMICGKVNTKVGGFNCSGYMP